MKLQGVIASTVTRAYPATDSRLLWLNQRIVYFRYVSSGSTDNQPYRLNASQGGRRSSTNVAERGENGGVIIQVFRFLSVSLIFLINLVLFA